MRVPRVVRSAALLLGVLPVIRCAQREGGASARDARATSIAPASPAAFASAYVDAIRAGDSAGLRRLMHPKVLACLSGANAEFLSTAVTMDLGRHADAAGDYKVSATPVQQHLALLPDSLFSYPVEPTQQVQLDFQREGGSGLTMVRELAPSDGGWLMTFPCPTPAGLRVFRLQRAEGARQEARARQLAAELEEPLRAQLVALLRQHKRLDAISQYRTASGQDGTTAVRVIDVLQKEQ